MFNNRMLAVAAVLALAIPALGAAAPIVAPPAPEQLVEGHTVFTVIEVARRTDATEERFAAAVAVLVREFKANSAAVRFPGVLWFNDQYLVEPDNPSSDPYANYRYPCGGAVMAVSSGSPDPRMFVARATVSSGVTAPIHESYGEDSNNDTSYGASDPHWYGEGDPTYGEYAWIDATVDATDPANPAYAVSSDTIRTSVGGVDYEESYRITDPNDHQWIVDKYKGYSRVSNSAVTPSQVYSFPVWVVNVLGTPVFVPDDGESTCNPFYDLITLPLSAAGGQDMVVPDALYEETRCTDGERTESLYARDYPARDDPCAGYNEPANAGGALYCYGGQPAVDADGDGSVTKADCLAQRSSKPLRLYNAVLYFQLEDLGAAEGTADHGATSTATNGCQNGTEWTCPGGDELAEGNSHPFHPTTAVAEKQPCPYGFDNTAEGSDHGGSTTAAADCDNLHAVQNIDVYFSGAGRPFAPLSRTFAVDDTEGSSQAFHDHSTQP